ncbi:MAG: hypothetical protein J5936_02705 [Acholeplasmatales bacterium]|nr:hypothetical protein [Acholeplasmatales bacterium]
MYITNIETLCEAIQCSLSGTLKGIYTLGVQYHTPSLQIRITIRFESGCTVYIKLKREEYKDLLDDNATEWDYGQFIAMIKDIIKEYILEQYIR